MSPKSSDGVTRAGPLHAVKAISLASRLFPAGELPHLSINFLPNAVYEPSACLRATLAAARKSSFPLTSIMFEFTES